jgi:hypothetical protein
VVAPTSTEAEVDLDTETSLEDMLTTPSPESLAQVEFPQIDKSLPSSANETDISFTDEDEDFDIYATDEDEEV